MVLAGIFNLEVLQQGLGSDPRYQKGIEGDYSGTEFGGALKKYFPYDEEDCGMGVYRGPLSAGGLIDKYEIEISEEEPRLTLDKIMGDINNLDWGISELRRQRPLAEDPAKTEEFILSREGDAKGTVHPLRVIRNSAGDILFEQTLATFIKGNPYPVK
ncbi:MAG: hypothetical protein NUW06_06520 [Candidatus Acetothermia bacterium]|nr:hypothetical protein [Candidatus Acetothermia bacterium]